MEKCVAEYLVKWYVFFILPGVWDVRQWKCLPPNHHGLSLSRWLHYIKQQWRRDHISHCQIIFQNYVTMFLVKHLIEIRAQGQLQQTYQVTDGQLGNHKEYYSDVLLTFHGKSVHLKKKNVCEESHLCETKYISLKGFFC